MLFLSSILCWLSFFILGNPFGSLALGMLESSVSLPFVCSSFASLIFSFYIRYHTLKTIANNVSFIHSFFHFLSLDCFSFAFVSIIWAVIKTASAGTQWDIIWSFSNQANDCDEASSDHRKGSRRLAIKHRILYTVQGQS